VRKRAIGPLLAARTLLLVPGQMLRVKHRHLNFVSIAEIFVPPEKVETVIVEPALPNSG